MSLRARNHGFNRKIHQLKVGAEHFLTGIKPHSDEGLLGFRDQRSLENMKRQFSFRKKRHVIIGILCFTLAIVLSYSISWAFSSHGKIEKQHARDLEEMNLIFQDEMKFMKTSHENTVKSMKELHESTIGDEMKWFANELSLIDVRKKEMGAEHSEKHSEYKEAYDTHEKHKEHSEKLDSSLNDLYLKAGKKIDETNAKLKRCKEKKSSLENARKEERPERVKVEYPKFEGYDYHYY